MIDDSGTAIITLFDKDCAKFLDVLAEQLRKNTPKVMVTFMLYISVHILNTYMSSFNYTIIFEM